MALAYRPCQYIGGAKMVEESKNDPKKTHPDSFDDELAGALDDLFAEPEEPPPQKAGPQEQSDHGHAQQPTPPESAPAVATAAVRKPPPSKTAADKKPKQPSPKPAVKQKAAPAASQMVPGRRSHRYKLLLAAALVLIALAVLFAVFLPGQKRSEPVKTTAAPTVHRIPRPAPVVQNDMTPQPSAAQADRATAALEPQALPPSSQPAALAPQTSEEKAQTDEAGVQPVTVAQEIETFLLNWKTAWEKSAGANGDIPSYMACYSDAFVSGKFDKTAWEKDKATKNSRKRWIKIELGAISVSEPFENGRYKVRFTQDYRSSNYSSVSDKTLILQKEATGWKILTNMAPVVFRPYAIHAGSYRRKQQAENAIEAYKKMGLQAFWTKVDLKDRGTWYRVMIGCYATQGAAQKAIADNRLADCKPEKIAYAVLIGTFMTAEKLDDTRTHLSENGFSPYVIDDGMGQHRLFVGAFYSKPGADALQKELASKGISGQIFGR